MKNEIIEVQGRLFQVLRKFPENRINLEKGSIEDLKLFFHCDTLFKAQGLLWMVNEIKDVSYEETEETE
jgi:hypothetical protein|tara:strand:+ start:145 stop:351 length:207 start_codon:yes stop_codon:yes gene_type:complete